MGEEKLYNPRLTKDEVILSHIPQIFSSFLIASSLSFSRPQILGMQGLVVVTGGTKSRLDMAQAWSSFSLLKIYIYFIC